MKYISVISILFYTLFFGIGPGSIPLMITAELFTQGSRPAAMSVSVLVNWFSNFVVGLTFPLMKVSLDLVFVRLLVEPVRQLTKNHNTNPIPNRESCKATYFYRSPYFWPSFGCSHIKT